jgi:glycosyltransferase involved in cell wall biosynthesis
VRAERWGVLSLIKGLGPGGAERLLVNAAAVRDRDRFAYETAYLLPWKDALVPELEADGVAVHCLGGGAEHDVRWAVRLRRLLVAKRFDVLHVHSPYVASIARLVACTVPRASRPALVSTEHNGWSSFALPTRLLNAATLPLSDAVITVSSHVERSIWKPFRRRSETIVHGIPLARVRAALAGRDDVRAELGAPPDVVLVGTVANYTPQKDWPNLLRAARLVADAGARIRFCAVGQGPLEEEVQALHRELALESVVRITGYRPDAVRLMAGCDVFVLASRFEGLPVALMEALVLGLPVVATEVGGVPEAITSGVEGVLVPPERPDRLAAALQDLAAEPEARARMAQAARARGEDFDITRAVRVIESIYEDVTRGRPPHFRDVRP